MIVDAPETIAKVQNEVSNDGGRRCNPSIPKNPHVTMTAADFPPNQPVDLTLSSEISSGLPSESHPEVSIISTSNITSNIVSDLISDTTISTTDTIHSSIPPIETNTASQDIDELLHNALDINKTEMATKINPLQCPNCKKIFGKPQHLDSHLGTHKGYKPPVEWLKATNRRICPKCKKMCAKTSDNQFQNEYYHPKCKPIPSAPPNKATSTPSAKPITNPAIATTPTSPATTTPISASTSKTVANPFAYMKGYQNTSPITVEINEDSQQTFIQPELPTIYDIFKTNIPTRSFIPKTLSSEVSKALIYAIDMVLKKNDSFSWSQLLAMPKCLFNHKGIDQTSNSFVIILKKRLHSFLQGNWTHLWTQAKQDNKDTPSIINNFSKNWKDITIQKAEVGNISAAFKALNSSPLSKPTEDTFNKLCELHPNIEEFKGVEEMILNPPELDFKIDLDKTIITFPKGTSPGPDGLRVQHLLDILRCNPKGSPQDPREAIVKLMKMILNGKAYKPIAEFLSSAKLTPISKKNGGIRPIAVGCVWRRLAAKIILREETENAFNIVQPEQMGIGCKYGIEKIVHTVRLATLINTNPNFALLQIDLINAFNKASRNIFLKKIKEKLPRLYQFACFCYCNKPKLFLINFIKEILSENGSQQGDPLGPLFFALALDDLAKSISAKFPNILNMWYLDDGNILGDIHTLLDIVKFIENEGPKYGLFLNRSKTTIFFPNADKDEISNKFSDILPQDIQLEFSGTNVLGIPIGKEEFTNIELSKNLEKHQLSIKRLIKLEDAQVAFRILHSCMGLCSINYHIRCTPPQFSKKLANDYDELIMDTLSKIMGANFTKNQIDQIQLPMKLGGLGLKCASKHKEAAFISSFNSSESFLTTKFDKEDIEKWIGHFLEDAKSFDNRKLEYSKCQKTISEDIDISSQKILIHNLRSPGAQARYLSTIGKQGPLILCAPLGIPRGFRLSNQEFLTFLKLRIGLDVCTSDKCRHCPSKLNTKLDTKGTHILMCKWGDFGPVHRHDDLKNILFSYCQKALFNPRLEVPLKSGTKKAPADIYLPSGSNGKPAAIDITIAHPLAVQVVEKAAQQPGHAASVAEKKKMLKYEDSCKKENIKFVPTAFEVFGHMSENTINFIEKIGTAIANRTNTKKNKIITEIIRKLQFSLIRSSNMAIASRAPGGISI